MLSGQAVRLKRCAHAVLGIFAFLRLQKIVISQFKRFPLQNSRISLLRFTIIFLTAFLFLLSGGCTKAGLYGNGAVTPQNSLTASPGTITVANWINRPPVHTADLRIINLASVLEDVNSRGVQAGFITYGITPDADAAELQVCFTPTGASALPCEANKSIYVTNYTDLPRGTGKITYNIRACVLASRSLDTSPCGPWSSDSLSVPAGTDPFNETLYSQREQKAEQLQNVYDEIQQVLMTFQKDSAQCNVDEAQTRSLQMMRAMAQGVISLGVNFGRMMFAVGSPGSQNGLLTNLVKQPATAGALTTDTTAAATQSVAGGALSSTQTFLAPLAKSMALMSGWQSAAGFLGVAQTGLAGLNPLLGLQSIGFSLFDAFNADKLVTKQCTAVPSAQASMAVEQSRAQSLATQLQALDQLIAADGT